MEDDKQDSWISQEIHNLINQNKELVGLVKGYETDLKHINDVLKRKLRKLRHQIEEEEGKEITMNTELQKVLEEWKKCSEELAKLREEGKV